MSLKKAQQKPKTRKGQARISVPAAPWSLPTQKRTSAAGPSARDPPRGHRTSAPAYVRTEIRVPAPLWGLGPPARHVGMAAQMAPHEAGGATTPGLRPWGLCTPLLGSRTFQVPVGSGVTGAPGTGRARASLPPGICGRAWQQQGPSDAWSPSAPSPDPGTSQAGRRALGPAPTCHSAPLK